MDESAQPRANLQPMIRRRIAERSAKMIRFTQTRARFWAYIACAVAFCLFMQLQNVATAQSEQEFDGVFHSSKSEGVEEAYLQTISPSSHAANLLLLENGDLLCFWFSGTHEGDSNVAIVMSRLAKGSRQWTSTTVVDHQEGRSFQNPVAFQTPGGRVRLLHTSQPAGQGQSHAEVLYLTSDDAGRTWTTPQPMFAQPGSFTRHPPVLINDKTWILPMYYTPSRSITDGAESHYSAMQLTSDGGKKWKECEVSQSHGLVQPSVVKLADGTFFALFRSRYADFIYQSTSRDGCDWTAPTPTHLPNNNSSIQLVKLHDGSLVLAFNNSSAGITHDKPATSARKPLSIALSRDGGASWPWVRDIETGKAAGTPTEAHTGHAKHEEYSYPSVLQDARGKIYVAYSYDRETIKVVRFDEKWIKQGQSEGEFKNDGVKN
jgi:predicted neuraminidase